MPGTIYFNNSGNLIEEALTSQLTSYIVVQLDHEDNFKIVKFIDNNIVSGIEYFLSENETYEYAFEKFSQFETISFYKKEKSSGKYSQYEVLTVNKQSTITGKRIQVLSNNLLPIYDKAINIENGSTIYFAKHYYDEERNIQFEFEYNDTDDTLKKISVYDPGLFVDTDDHTILPAQVGIGKNPFGFDWKDFEYYRFAEPILPE